MTFDLARLGHALSPVDADVRDQLSEYLHVVRQLTARPLFGPGALAIHLEPRDDSEFDVTAQAPVDWDGLRGAMTYFRRAWMNDERTCFSRVRNLIRLNATTRGGPDADSLVELLDEIGKQHPRARKELPDMAVLEGHAEDGEIVGDGQVSAERIIDDWFNGEIFHGDPKRRSRLDAAGDPDAYVFALMIVVQEVTRVYVQFARLTKAILAEPTLQPRTPAAP